MAKPLPAQQHTTSEGTPDIRALMESIRERITKDVEANRDRYPTRPPSTSGEGAYRQGNLQHSEELAFLNRNYAYELKLSGEAISTHRGGFIGKLIVKGKRKFVAFLRNAILRDYLQGERAFQENLVRFLNEIGRYVDARDDRITQTLAENFHRHIDRVADDSTSSFVSLDQRTALGFSDLIDRIQSLDGLVRGLEGIVNNIGTYRNPTPPTAVEAGAQGELTIPDIGYLLLENRYRGSEHLITERLAVYPPLFVGAPGTVLEIGSGRGELQKLLTNAGITTYGVDLDAAMVNVANSSGLKTLHGDGIAHLRSLEDRSLGGLIAVQVVEHLTRAQLHELFTLVQMKLKPGAKAIFETINPQSLLALSSNYFRDPTHVWPLHPDTLGYMATLAGLQIVETKYLSPVSPNSLLREIPIDTTLKPNVSDAIHRINANITQLNRLLYGHQDYALVLEVR